MGSLPVKMTFCTRRHHLLLNCFGESIKVQIRPKSNNFPKDVDGLLWNKNKLTLKFFDKFYQFLKSYASNLKSYFPDQLVSTYRIFSDGSRSLLSDMRTYSRLRRLLFQSSDTHRVFAQLTRTEMELFLTLPQDLIKVAPVMAISALPLAQNIVFPLAMVFPTIFLSSHFWTQEEKEEVSLKHLRNRHLYFKPTFRKLQEQLPLLKGSKDYTQMRLVLGKLGAGLHPNHAEILKTAPVFSPGGRFSLNNIGRKHAYLLIAVNGHTGLQDWLMPHKKLKRISRLISSIDKALDREGIDLLDAKDLRRVCNLRGLNVDHLGKENMVEYLLKWNIVSCSLTEEQLSLLLHLPILLGYNHQNRFWSQEFSP